MGRGRQLPGDVNQNAQLDMDDAIDILIYLFARKGNELPCEGETAMDGGNHILFDVNGDANVSMADPIYLLFFLFKQGPPPVKGLECVSIEGCPDTCL